MTMAILSRWVAFNAYKCYTLPSVNTFGVRNYSDKQSHYDIVVIGGGIVGSATARELLVQHPSLKIALLEKESKLADHQTGNNSGVIHAGIYYKPGSLKAKLCVQGMNLLYQYCDEKKIKYSKCGKLIVATEQYEVPRLLELYERGLKNNVKGLKLLDNTEIKEYASRCLGLQAIWSPETGVISFRDVTNALVDDFVQRGGKCYLKFEVNKFLDSKNADYPVMITDLKTNTVLTKYVLTCCGLHSDKVAQLTGCLEDPKIIPFRGEYLYLTPKKKDLALTNIYPVPDPRFPFLGVHLTPTIDGKVIIGPNAILAFCREGYRWSDFNLTDLKEIVGYSGFQRLAFKYAAFGIKEMIKSAIIPLQIKGIQKYVPDITAADVVRGPSGVRAQAMTKDGTLVEDFVFDSRPSGGAIGSRVLHCRNAPSPGATSALAIASMISDKMKEQFKL